jgi:hypothetical protein
MNLCKYKNIFGKPGEGVHKYRLFNIAIIDVVFTIIGAYFLHKKINKKYSRIEFYQVLIFLFICGIIAHRAFCVRTTVDKLIFG